LSTSIEVAEDTFGVDC